MVFTATGAGTGTGTADEWDTGAQEVQFNLKGADDTFTNASDMATGVLYEIYSLGDTDWNTVAGTSGVTYAVGDEVTSSGSGHSGTGIAMDLRPDSGQQNSFSSFTSTSSTPHATNLEFVASRMSFRDVYDNHQYDFPRKDGSANQVITTDGAGRLTFQNAPVSNLSILSDNQQFINGSAQGLSSGSLQNGVLTITTDNSGWDKSQLMLKDSNGKALAITGEDYTSSNKHRLAITFDPEGDHNPSGGGTGDYGMYWHKDYSDLSAGVKMGWDVFGAQDGFEWRVRGDNNGGTNSYDYEPIDILSDTFTLKSRNGYASVTDTLAVSSTKVEAKVPVQFPSYTTTERNALSAVNGMQIYNSTTSKMQAYAGGSWVDLHS